jgi:hypothetical protein
MLAEVQKNQANMQGQVNAMQSLDFTDGLSNLLAGGSSRGNGDSDAGRNAASRGEGGARKRK